jgi:bifunctional DNA-binding transcriptional regulator/antitoxin component of YhaV-PrlF toxin-antitoxin module
MKVETSVVTSKGQLAIPARLSQRFGNKKGTLVASVGDDGHMIAQPVTPEFIRSLRELLKGEPCELEVLLEERKSDRTQ